MRALARHVAAQRAVPGTRYVELDARKGSQRTRTMIVRSVDRSG